MASAAKQSRGRIRGLLDCFVAEFIIGPAEGRTRWLLAMTRKTTHSIGCISSQTLSRSRACCSPCAPSGQHLPHDLSAEAFVGECASAPPPAILFHLAGRGDKAVSAGPEIRIGIIQAEDQAPGPPQPTRSLLT